MGMEYMNRGDAEVAEEDTETKRRGSRNARNDRNGTTTRFTTEHRERGHGG